MKDQHYNDHAAAAADYVVSLLASLGLLASIANNSFLAVAAS